MIEIEIDCNGDLLSIRDENGKLICATGVKYPEKYIDLFRMIFDRIDDNINPNGVDLIRSLNVKITKIDEDKKTTVEEW